MGTYLSNTVAYDRWITSVHTDVDWRSPPQQHTVPVITPVVVKATAATQVMPDRMSLGQWTVTLGGLVVVVLFLVATFLPIFV